MTIASPVHRIKRALRFYVRDDFSETDQIAAAKGWLRVLVQGTQPLAKAVSARRTEGGTLSHRRFKLSGNPGPKPRPCRITMTGSGGTQDFHYPAIDLTGAVKFAKQVLLLERARRFDWYCHQDL